MPLYRTLGFLVLALITAVGLSQETFANATVQDEPTHTVSITYADGEGPFHQAKIEIIPLENGTRPPWEGEVDGLTILSSTGHWIYIDELLSSGHQTGVVAESFLPTGETVMFVAVHTRRSGWTGWQLGNMREIIGREFRGWTHFINPAASQAVVTQVEEQCSTAGCSGLVDPWTCECFDDIRDPWEVRQNPSRVSFVI